MSSPQPSPLQSQPAVGDNPYAPPLAEQGSPLDEDFDVACYKAYVGSRWGYYLSKWGLLPGTEPRIGFNLAAFIFSMFWIAYRKMYLVAVLFGALTIVETAIEELVVYAMGWVTTSPAWDLFITIANGVLVAVFANRVYHWQVRREIERATTLGFRGEALLFELKRRGGTSLLAAFGIVLLMFFVSIAAFLLIELLLYGPEMFLEAG